MPNQLPQHLIEKVENTLALLDSIRSVDPPMDLAARIMARIHEACQPGYYPLLDNNAGQEVREEGEGFADPQLVYVEERPKESTRSLSFN